MENLSGTNVKGYELRERIGAGGFGAVYRAYQSSVGREVAVKMILPHFANHPDFIRRFEAEAGLVARLEHPHIIPLHDYWRDTSGAYLVMRWLRGGSLREALKAGPYELRAAALLLDQVTSALSLAHRNRIVHRDLKPANILLDEDGNAYVADFGIAKDLGKISATQGYVVVGSPDYLSPEQARSELVSPQTDIYSLGVLLYEVLTGQHPYPDATPLERMYKHLNDPLPSVTTLPLQVADGVNAVIQKATAKNPAHRYEDVLALAAAFQDAAGLQRQRNGDSVVEVLTRREQEVLQRIIDGQSNKQIAQELVITLGTAKWYVNQIFAKLHVRNRVQAIVRARELNLIASGNKVSLTSVPAVPTDQFAPENPYKGLRAFQAADSQDFFGREVLIDKLVKRLGETGDMAHFLAVIGPSGSGKSSLVKAGLIPALWKGALPGSERWFVAEMLPAAHPLDELEIALTRMASSPSANLREQLERDERGLLRAAQLILPNDGSQFVLIIDQFEEVFTLVEEEPARVHFLNLIRQAVSDPRSRVRVVVTLRADFYDRPLLYPEFGELVRSRMETVLPLTAEGLERAIVGPAERVGVKFEPGLVASIVSEVNYQPGALPLLQYALTELFDRRQGRVLAREAYQEIGGTVGALARRADEIFEGLDAESQETAHQMFLRLVTLGEGVEDTGRRVRRSELRAITADGDSMDDIIDGYAAYRLLSLDHDPATRSPTVEVAHEAILREWKRLQGWLNESRHDIRMQRMLGAAAAEWLNAGRDNSFLLRGSRLEQFQGWASETNLALTPYEREYLDASLAERERQTIAEQRRQAREAALERRSRNFLRGLVAVLIAAALVGFGLSAVAINKSQIADRNAAESQNVALVAGSQAALEKGDTDQAIALALAAIRLNPTSGPAQVALGQAAYAPGTVRRFVGHAGEVLGVALSPDGRLALSGSDDLTLILWDITTGAMVRRFTGGHTKGHIRVAFSPDGRTVLSGADDGLIILWDVETGKIIRRFEGHTGWVGAVVFSPDGKTVLSCSQDTTLILWDVTTGQIIRRFTGHTAPVWSVVFSADGRTALSGSENNIMILWDVTTGAILRQYNGEVMFDEVAMSADSRYALSTTYFNSLVYLWDLTTGQIIRRFKGHAGVVLSVVFSPDGQTALSGSGDGTIIQWDIQTGQVLKRLQGHAGAVNRVRLSADGRHAISGSADGTVRLWDLDYGQVIQRFPGHTNRVWQVAFAPDGQTVLTGSWDGTARLWDPRTGQELQRLVVMKSEPTYGIAYSPDSRTVLTGAADWSSQAFNPSDVILWNAQTGQEIHRFTGHPAQLQDVVFSPDGQTFLSGAADGSLFLWDVQSGQILRRFTGNIEKFWSLALSPDGQQALSGGFSGSLILWDVRTGQIIRRFIGHKGAINTVRFSRDGRTALSGGANGAYVWDLKSGAILRSFPEALGATYSPDELLIFMGYRDQSNVLWDASTGTVIRQFLGAGEGILRPVFSLDGRSVLGGFTDGHAELWRIDTLDELIAWTHTNRYVTELTCDQRALYHLTPACEASGAVPTVTPYPTDLPSTTTSIPVGG